jgi:crotonobetainyl-CoA:carnitine CoA-transferase CaiB-like acyl-CoA transferase
MKHTRTELYEGAIQRRIQLYPVAAPREALESPQLAARNYWVEIEHPELDTIITYPGAFVKLSETPCRIRHRAPLIGEHNEEVYRTELGLTEEELVMLKQHKVI